jgi:hypothetical protein
MRCVPLVLLATLTAITPLATPLAKLKDAAPIDDGQVFLNACANSYLIKTADCPCARMIFRSRLSEQRMSLASAMLTAFAPRRRMLSLAREEPICLRILEQEGSSTYAFLDIFMSALREVRRDCAGAGFSSTDWASICDAPSSDKVAGGACDSILSKSFSRVHLIMVTQFT